MVNGETESLAARQYRDRKEKIEQFELSTYDISPAYSYVMELGGVKIRKMSAEECGETAVDISILSLHINKIYNKEKSLLNWLNSRINLTIVGELNNFVGYYSKEQRRDLCINNDSYAKELEEFRINTQNRVDVLEGVVGQLNQLCKIVRDNQFLKSGGNYGQKEKQQ